MQLLDRVVRPALSDVANEFESQGYQIDRNSIPHVKNTDTYHCLEVTT